MSARAQAPWPGQPGNPVGYAAYGALGTTPWPGGGFTSGTAGNPTIYDGYVFTGAQSISGSYIEFIHCDFNSGAGGVSVRGDHITFVGSRFQSNSVANFNVQSTGSIVTFFYDSFTPLTSLYASPPGAAWPSAGAGQNTTTQTINVNSIDGNSGYQYGVNIISGGPVTIDHCDIWGFGNAVVFYSTTAQMVLTNSWIHDSANASAQGYHTDGPGYLNGGAGPSNVVVRGNTIAAIGNTNGLAFQAATSGYNNMQIQYNYFSGFGYTVAPGNPGATHFSNSTVFANVFGTDLESYYGPLYRSSFPTGINTVWACNTLAFAAGTNWTDGDGWTPTSAINGQYWVPTSGISSATDNNGNTICPSLAPSSIAFKQQAKNAASSAQAIQLKNAGSATITISSISLQTGTQFAISSNTCGSSLGVGASCSVAVTFTPTAIGIASDNLQIFDNAPAPSSPQSIPLIGLGSAGSGTAPNPPTGLAAAVN